MLLLPSDMTLVMRFSLCAANEIEVTKNWKRNGTGRKIT